MYKARFQYYMDGTLLTDIKEYEHFYDVLAQLHYLYENTRIQAIRIVKEG